MNNNREKLITLSHKIRFEPLDDNWENLKWIFRDLQDEINKVMNRMVFAYWSFDAKSDIAKDMRDEKISIKELKDNPSSVLTYMNRKNKTIFVNTNGEVIEQAHRDAIAKYKYNKKKMDYNEGFIPRFGSNQPIPIKNSAFKIEKTDKGEYILTARLLSKKYAESLYKGINYSYITNGKKKEIKYSRPINDIKMRFKLVVKPKDKRTQEILDKCINGEYKQGSSKILRKVKGKWFFSLSYSFQPKIEKGLNPNKIMGIDMGIIYPVYMAFNDSSKRYFIEGGEIKHFKKKIESQRKQLLRQGKYCGKGRRGHGRKTRIKPIQKLQNKIENFKNTTNHRYARYVVDTAVKHNCGVIQMEDLSGIADVEKKASFLGDWTYYDLQQKIKYKAEEKGIEVKFINRRYTSQRCSKCGIINKDNRQNQANFHCTTCGFKANADYNAAKNISIPNIDKIIDEQLELQQKQLVHNLKYIAN